MPFGQFYGGPEQHSLAGFASDKNQVTWGPDPRVRAPAKSSRQAGVFHPDRAEKEIIVPAETANEACCPACPGIA